MKVFKKHYGDVLAFYTEDIYEASLTEKNKKKYSIKQYRNIIKVYMQVYFEDLYRNPFSTTYFFLTGKMKLCQQRWKGNYYIKWMWYYQPLRYIKMRVVIKKITRAGNGNILSNLEKKLKEKIDIGMLPSREVEHKGNSIKKINYIDEHNFNSL